ncbi:chemotaxis-specific protein-glutamate methyltransferase CheB [Povalibacter sp.]|uniref:chemotaxis-specific protein-glutamate methyltransferase CheB n=1 Tax=Povalibacter sp. TaxID=1962978 RepID=UPI002F41D78B
MIKVLVVDDSALVRKLFGRVLTEEPGFEIAFARNGLEAIEQLEAFKPDVITLDVNMPQMNGLECLDRIMVLRPCPVVMVSAVTAEGADSTLDALRLGAVDFVPKPSGAVSLRIDQFAPTLLEKIRSAATARIPASRRLRERVQLRSGSAPTTLPGALKATRPVATGARVPGNGLVLVGTSTGGPPALEALLVPLPQTFAWPILVAQHMPASFTGPLARRLDGICSVNVVEVTRPMLIEAGCVYIARGDADVVVSRRAAGLFAMPAPAKPDYPWHPSTDRLVRSAMEHVPARQLVGVLMTGMGNDGSAAMAQLRAEGGRTIAEAEETAVVWGMPGELVRAGGADWVVPLPRITEQLQKLVPANAAHS